MAEIDNNKQGEKKTGGKKLLFFEYKINCKNKKAKSDKMVPPKGFIFKSDSRKDCENH